MTISSITPLQLEHLIAAVGAHIAQQRSKYFPRAQPIAPRNRAPLAHHFSEDLLNSTRILHARTLENPVFYSDLERIGLSNLPQFRSMAAITYIDVVVAQEELTPALLFHELVHVVQYRQLGLTRFAEQYVRGFLETGKYLSIPLERVAYHLEHMFRLRPDVFIDVAKHAANF